MSPSASREEPPSRQRSERSRWWMVTIVVSGSLCVSIVYANVQSFDLEVAEVTGLTDTLDYLAMAEGGEGTGIRAYRPLVPELVALLPDVPASFFNAEHRSDPRVAEAYKFSVVNLAFLFAACLAMFAFLLGFGLEEKYAFIGVMMFLGMREVVRTGGLPLSDTAFYFFFLLCLIAIQRDNLWLLLVAATVGAAAKELVLLCIPLALLATLPWRRRLMLVAATLPGVMMYVVIRLYYGPGPVDGYLRGESLAHVGDELRALVTPNGFLNTFLAFGILWMLAIYAFAKCDIPSLLRRWTWLVPLVWLGVILGQGNLGRSHFTAFPVVIALAVFGLKGWLWGDRRSGLPAADPPVQLSASDVSP